MSVELRAMRTEHNTLAACAQSSAPRLLIVGNPEEHHVGAHFLSAARGLGCEARLLDLRQSESTNRWVNRIFRRALRHRPARLGRFSESVVVACIKEFRPDILLRDGALPHARRGELAASATWAYSGQISWTDDPWNPANGRRVFPCRCALWYDVIFRRAVRRPSTTFAGTALRLIAVNIHRLAHTTAAVHFPETDITDAERAQFAATWRSSAVRMPIACRSPKRSSAPA